MELKKEVENADLEDGYFGGSIKLDLNPENHMLSRKAFKGRGTKVGGLEGRIEQKSGPLEIDDLVFGEEGNVDASSLFRKE